MTDLNRTQAKLEGPASEASASRRVLSWPWFVCVLLMIASVVITQTMPAHAAHHPQESTSTHNHYSHAEPCGDSHPHEHHEGNSEEVPEEESGQPCEQCNCHCALHGKLFPPAMQFPTVTAAEHVREFLLLAQDRLRDGPVLPLDQPPKLS